MVYAAKKFINNPNDVVTEFIEVLLRLLLDSSIWMAFLRLRWCYELMSRLRNMTVSVISGGGSGHEPAHVGYVGEGMLTAAICGDVFASPPVDYIFAVRVGNRVAYRTIRRSNYTGDRLNFGLAAEQAKSEGYKLETVIVRED